MAYAVVLLILLAGLICFNGKPYSRVSDSWLAIEWLSLVLLSGLRYRVGGDTLAYYDMYQNWPTLPEIFGDPRLQEYGVLWCLLLSACKSLTSDFVLVQIIHALFVNTSFFIFFRRRSKKVFVIILLYFLLYFFKYNTEVLRAAMAVSVFLWSYKYLVLKKWPQYLILSLVAIGFHAEAVVMLLFPLMRPLMRLRIDLKSLTVILVAAVLLLIPNFLPLFSRLFSFSESMSSRMEYYTDNSLLGKGISVIGYAKAFVWSFIWLYVLYVVSRSKRRSLKPFIIFHFFMSVIYIKYSNVFYRMMDFTIPVMLLAIGECMEMLKGRRLPLYFLYFCIGLLLFDQILYLLESAVLFYPYSSVFNPEDYTLREMYFREQFIN